MRIEQPYEGTSSKEQMRTNLADLKNNMHGIGRINS